MFIRLACSVRFCFWLKTFQTVYIHFGLFFFLVRFVLFFFHSFAIVAFFHVSNCLTVRWRRRISSMRYLSYLMFFHSQFHKLHPLIHRHENVLFTQIDSYDEQLSLFVRLFCVFATHSLSKFHLWIGSDVEHENDCNYWF